MPRATFLRTCDHCGVSYAAKAYNVTRGRAKYCGRSCQGAALIARRFADGREGAKNPNWKGGVSKIHVRYTDRFRAKFPEKAAAQRIVHRAVERGDLVRPAFCSACGVACKPHGHHDDYTRPLSVRWLCRLCHLAHHAAARRRKAA